METRPIAFQIYSAREEAAKDLASTLKAVAQIGYDGVEFAGFYGHSAEAVVQMLQDFHLEALSSHVPIDLIEADMDQVIAFHKAIGCSYIAVPFLDEECRPGGPRFAKSLRTIANFGRLCAEAGITLLYHNHDFEFITISGQYGLDFIYDAIDSSVLQTEIDVCWVKYAGVDPAAYIRKYAGRCPVIHLKDYIGEKSDKPVYELLGQASQTNPNEKKFEFKPFGHGCQDVESVLTASIESGAQWFVVEQDISTPYTPLEAARMSMETLRKVGVKK